MHLLILKTAVYSRFSVPIFTFFRVPVPKLPTTTYPECRGDPTHTLDCTTPPPQTNLTAYGDWLNFCQHDFYCGILDGLIDDSYECLQYSILDLWPNFKSPENFSSLSQDEILEAVNQVPLDSQLLNSVIDTYITPIRDENGYIIGAESLSLSLFGQSNSSLITEDDLSNAEDGVPVSREKLFCAAFFWTFLGLLDAS